MNLGLKLWSNNTDHYFDEAKRLYQEGWFDYIELYVVPETVGTIDKWKTLKIPFTLHAPHFAHGVNLAKKEHEQINYKVFEEVAKFTEGLNAQYVVVHSGIEGTIEETIRQLRQITAQSSRLTARLLVENKPYKAPLGEKRLCRGATIEEIKKVIDEVGCGFCLDVGHTICTANSLKLAPYEFLTQFNKLNPTCYHLSDNFIDSAVDGHMHLGKGNYDLKKIFDIIDTEKNIAIETNKSSNISLTDFVEDVKFLRNLEKDLPKGRHR